jgi:hypothetical protein
MVHDTALAASTVNGTYGRGMTSHFESFQQSTRMDAATTP